MSTKTAILEQTNTTTDYSYLINIELFALSNFFSSTDKGTPNNRLVANGFSSPDQSLITSVPRFLIELDPGKSYKFSLENKEDLSEKDKERCVNLKMQSMKFYFLDSVPTAYDWNNLFNLSGFSYSIDENNTLTINSIMSKEVFLLVQQFDESKPEFQKNLEYDIYFSYDFDETGNKEYKTKYGIIDPFIAHTTRS